MKWVSKRGTLHGWITCRSTRVVKK